MLTSKPYPEAECSGQSKSTGLDAYWFALKGRWFPNGSLLVDFVNTLERGLGTSVSSWSGNANANGASFGWKLAVETQVNKRILERNLKTIHNLKLNTKVNQPIHLEIRSQHPLFQWSRRR